MMTHKLTKLPKNTYQIDVTVPWEDIQNEYKSAFDLILAQFELKGYRKGKVPQELAQKHIPKDEVYQVLMRNYVPRVYEEVITKENITPIVSPRVELKKAKENEPWEFTFKVAEKPEVKLNNYREAVKKAKEEAKKTDIWVPGKDKEAKPEEANQQEVLNKVLDTLLNTVECEVPDILVEEELDQRLTKLVDDIQRLGLTTDAYLKSKNVTMDDLKAQFTKEITEMYKMEFILLAIAEDAKISVEQADLDKLLGAITDEKERAAAAQNAYFYASILRKQKTLDFLTSL
jgi:trigger factor